MQLPGGVWRNGQRRRQYAFKPLTGELELIVAEGGNGAADLPGRISGVLTGALAQLGGEAPDYRTVHELCVGDRQFLMRRLASWLGFDSAWLSAVCTDCGERFDFPVEYARLPVKEAAAGYPYAEAHTSLGTLRLRLPTGADQQAIQGLRDDQALPALIGRCIVGSDSEQPNGQTLDFTAEDFERIEAAMEQVAPEVGTRADVACPDCGRQTQVYLDPYTCLGKALDSLFAEIHQLAASYHWSEQEILALPHLRRKRYLGLIDQARGMAY